MPNKEIIDYIKESKGKGFSDEEIKKALLGAEWEEKDVDEGLKSLVAEPKKNPIFKNKKFWIIALVVIVLLVVGFFVFRDRINEFLIRQREERASKELSRIIKEYNTELEKVSWKNFENQYFSFDYPENWDIVEDKTTLDDKKLFLRLSSPKTIRPVVIGAWETAHPFVSPYVISFSVYSLDQYLSRLDPYGSIMPYEDKKHQLIEAITNEDINKFKKLFIDDPLEIEKNRVIDSGGKEGFIRLTIMPESWKSDRYILLLGDLKFLSVGDVFEITFRDTSESVIPKPEPDANLIDLIKDRPYYKLIESIWIK